MATASTTVTRQLQHKAEDVWAILRDFGNLSWVEGPSKVEVEGEGQGMVRRLHIPGMDTPIDEILDSIDESKRSLTYKIPKNDIIPFDNYSATVSVSDKDGGAFIEWSCSLELDNMSEADASAMMEGNYNMLIDALDKKLSA